MTPDALAGGAIPAPVVEICQTLRDQGHRAWVVGGCLRDLLMGRPVSDWDVATSALPGDVQRAFRRVIPTGIQHGTVTVLWRGVPYEVTTLRGDGGYSDGRRPDSVYFVKTIDEDLSRRDFTVNAIAYDPLEDELTDPHQGVGDLARRTIRAVGNPVARFVEDGLRVLRAARFVATLEFDLDGATEAAIPEALATYERVSKERVHDEWRKTMRAARPSRAFEVMRRTGILGLTCPILLDQVECEQNRWHAHDVWHHTMACLDHIGGRGDEADVVLKMAALLHDIGKPKSRQWSDKTQDYTFYHHERIGADMAQRWLHEHRFATDERRTIVHLIQQHLICYERDWTDAAVRRFVRRVGGEHVERLIALARADALAKGRPVEDELAALDELVGRIADVAAAGAALSARDLEIDGRDVMQTLSIPASRRVGVILDALLERVLDDPSVNERAQLLELLPALAAELADDSTEAAPRPRSHEGAAVPEAPARGEREP